MAAKQHELLAFEKDIKSKATLILRETEQVFDRSSSFDEFSKTYKPFTEGDKDIPENEKKLMTTTVTERINYTSKALIKAINIIATKEHTNTLAKADIQILDEDGAVLETLAKDVPVTGLLSLEKQFQEYRRMYVKIPTFNTETSWAAGTNSMGIDCYVEQGDNVKVRNVTKKVTEAFDPNPVEGSEKFKLEPRDKSIVSPVGEYKTVTKTGRISPRDKADMIDRLDQVIIALKAARAKANSIEIVEMNIGKDLFGFINGTK